MIDVPENSLKSDEEKWFLWYCEELHKEGIVEEVTRAETINLSEPIYNIYQRKKSNGTRSVMLAQIYTPDFKIVWGNKTPLKLACEFGTENRPAEYALPQFFYHVDDRDRRVSTVEVKGSYIEGMESRHYSTMAKWVFQKTSVVINRIKVGNSTGTVFHRTFTPERFKLTDKTLKPRKIKFIPTSLKEYLET